ncbi:cell division protein SepF [Acholeplasma sp. OttesenSCG-928-E16]|nr:cell division protein SepF [Acholeplasma sp. OttesenSCG-928-E16]
MGLFSKSKKRAPVIEKEEIICKTAEKIVAEQLSDDSDSYLTNLAQKLIDGCPLILDFEPLDIDPANKALAFFSGVIFAIGGDIASIKDKIFLFTAKDAYDDGSLTEYLSLI